MRAENTLILLQLLHVFSSEGTFYGHYLARCQFNSPDSHDVVFLEQMYFNKVFMLQYNSTLGKTVGYTKKGEEFAEMLNKVPGFIRHEIWKTNHCKQIVQLAGEQVLTAVEPSVRLRLEKAEYSQHPRVLVCTAYDFYPKRIKVTWLKDGVEVTTDVTSTDELPNGNWLYQLRSYLEFTPKPGEKISCMVEHASLKEPKLYDWEPEPDSGQNMLVVGSAGLLLGLFFSLAGFLHYKRKQIGRISVPTTEDIYPENNL